MAKSRKTNPDSAITEQDAKFLYDEAADLREAGRTNEAQAKFAEVARLCGKRSETFFAQLAARALVSWSVELAKIGHVEEALAACNEAVLCYGDRPEPTVATQVARALVNKGITLDNVGRGEEALAVYDDLARRYGQWQQPDVAEQVARGLVRKGIALVKAGKVEEALEPLIEALRKGWPGTRVLAAQSLGETGTRSPQAFEAVTTALFDSEPSVRTAAAQAFCQLATPSLIPSLITLAVGADEYGNNILAEKTIMNMGASAGPELLLILSVASKPIAERRKALGLLAVLNCELDPGEAAQVLLNLFKDSKARSLWDRATEVLVSPGLLAAERMVAALDDDDQQAVAWVARSLEKLVEKARRPEQDLLMVLKQAVPKLERLHRKLSDNIPSEIREDAAFPHLRTLLALVEILPEADSAVEKLLATAGQEAHLWKKELLERRKRRPYRVEKADSEKFEQKPPLVRPEEDEQVRDAMVKINDLVAELPSEKKILAKTAALMTELPVEEGYETFKGAWRRVNQAIEQAFTLRLGDALTHHLVHRMSHNTHQDKKTSSTWLNHALREHKRALAFPGSGEPSNLRALIGGGSSHYRNGKYCIERRSDLERTRPQDLEQLLPLLHYIPAPSRQRATKEEMEQRSHAEREVDRRKGHGPRGRADK